MALKHYSLSPEPQSQENVPIADETVTSLLQELEMLFDVNNKTQLTTSTTVVAELTQLDIQTTPKPTTQEQTVNANANINPGENAQVDKDKFINIFSTPSEGNWDGPEYQYTADSVKKKEVKAFTFQRMETEEVCECYITPCFVESLDVYNEVTYLEYEKNLISNEFAINLDFNTNEDDIEPGVIFGCSFLRITKEIIDFGNRILTIYPNLIIFNDDLDDELDALLASIDVEDLPPLDITDIPPFVYNMRTNLRNKIKPSKIYKMSYDGDVLLDKLKLDGEFELEEEMVREELIKGYRAIREKSDHGCLEGIHNYRALVDTRSNITVRPYRIYELLGRDKVKPISNKITMIDHSKATYGKIARCTCQLGVTIILTNFMLLDLPVDRDMPIIVGRSFIYACGAIMNTIKGNMTTFNGFVHQQYDVVKFRSNHKETYNDDDEEYYLKRGEMEKPFYGPNHSKYLNCDDPMDRALALQDAVNPYRKVCIWKKAISFLRALPVLLKNTKWAPNRSGTNA
nr:hypothetical protein [Tanacetum cinerariifolium]